MRTRLTTVTAALATAGALALSAAPGAQASSGIFSYHTPHGQVNVIHDPQINHCYQVEGPAMLAMNHTNDVARLYVAGGCQGRYVPVAPGRQGATRFDSVTFVP